jgi:hypothetical protein
MQDKHLTNLLIDYVNWRSRYVGQRPRAVSTDPITQADPRWTAHATGIQSFLDKVRRGDDLTPHLSIEPHTRGYTPAAHAQGATVRDKWSDKDFVLNIMGYHHFHLGTTIQRRGHADRTDELMFAKVGRDTLDVIAIFDHEVFDPGSSERKRLWAAHDTIALQGAPPGSIVVSGLIATSGHAVHAVRYAQRCALMIRDVEPKLDEPDFVKSLYHQPEEAPANPKPNWGFVHLDLAILDAAKPCWLILKKGWN